MRKAESEPRVQGSWHSGNQDSTISLKVQGPPRALHPQPHKAEREVRTKAGSAECRQPPSRPTANSGRQRVRLKPQQWTLLDSARKAGRPIKGGLRFPSGGARQCSTSAAARTAGAGARGQGEVQVLPLQGQGGSRAASTGPRDAGHPGLEAKSTARWSPAGTPRISPEPTKALHSAGHALAPQALRAPLKAPT